MAQVLSPDVASHLRASRYAQRERPAASIPNRISARRLNATPGAPVPQRSTTSPVIALLLALRGPVI
jgi:hypothetical protein